MSRVLCLGETIGVGKGRSRSKTLNLAQQYSSWTEPGTNHPRMLTALQKPNKMVASWSHQPAARGG